MKKIYRRYKLRKAILLLISLISIFSTNKVLADSLSSKGNEIPKSWFKLGVGAKKFKIFFNGNIFFHIDDKISIGARSAYAFEVRDPFINPWEYYWDITPAVAYTPIIGSFGMVSGFVGAGIASGLRRGQFLRQEGLVVEKYEEIRFRRFCLAIELSGTVFIPRTRGLGISISMFKNINNEQPFTGYTIGIQFNRTR